MRGAGGRDYRGPVGPREVGVPELLRKAEAAQQSHAWQDAYASLRQVQALGKLDTEQLNDLAFASWWLGLAAETLEITEQLHHSFLEQGQVDRAALHAIELAMLWMMRGDLALGSGWLSRARRLADTQPPGPVHGFLRYVDVSAALDAFDIKEALAGALEMQEMGRRFANPSLAALGLMAEGVARIKGGDVRRGLGVVDEAMLPVVAGQVEPDWAGSIYCSVMAICHELADIRRARQWTDATERWCREFSAAVMFVGICRVHRVQLLSTGGVWADAEREALRVCEELADLNTGVVAESRYQLGELFRVRGRSAQAEAAYAAARALGRSPQPGESLLRLTQGRTDEAWEAIVSAVADSGSNPFAQARLLSAQGEIALATGRVDAAEAAASALGDICRSYDSPGFCAWHRHTEGAVLLARGRPEQALPLLRAACREYQQVGAPYDEARVRLLLARCHRALGDGEAAIADERTAGTVLSELGAAPVVLPDRVGDAPGETHRDTSGTGGLTGREVEVLQHIAAGETTREIAGALMISEKTVGRHLANIFAKLGVGTRTAAAAWAYDHGIRPQRVSR